MVISWLPAGGTNVFQAIKDQRGAARERGIKIIDLSIGQPAGPAMERARVVVARSILSDLEEWHEYPDNGCPPLKDFAQRFIAGHFEDNSYRLGAVDYLPIPGIKPVLIMVPLACGSHLVHLKVGTTTTPGYPTPRVVCGYVSAEVYELPLNQQNDFRFQVEDIPGDVKLIMMNYPHNPTGQIASEQWLRKLCAYCEENGIRLFNDAAYVALDHSGEHTSLYEIALDFPTLSWAEAYSASKLIGNGTGWRVGSIVGSPDFIADLRTIKGNIDSGFNSALAVGALAALEDDWDEVDQNTGVYGERLGVLIDIITQRGMRLAFKPKAGFFVLCEVPKFAFGVEIRDAEHLNELLIENTGVVGVPFGKFIRFSVAHTDIFEEQDELREAFNKADVSY